MNGNREDSGVTAPLGASSAIRKEITSICILFLQLLSEKHNTDSYNKEDFNFIPFGARCIQGHMQIVIQQQIHAS